MNGFMIYEFRFMNREKTTKSNKKLSTFNFQLSTDAGFTLIEVVLVLMMTAIVFVGIFALYANTIKNDVESRYEIIASNLAQEGVEIVRNVRDESVLNGGLNDGNINDDLSTGSCYPYISAAGAICDNSHVEDIELVNGLYQNSSAALTDPTFERVCDISDDGSPTEKIIVKCTVSWKSFVDSSIQRDVTVTSVLTNWR